MEIIMFPSSASSFGASPFGASLLGASKRIFSAL